MFTSLRRIIGFAINDFGRNKGTSIAAVFVLVIIIMLVTGLYFFHIVTDYVVLQIQNKIDIAAYFKSDTQESDILSVKDEILKMTPNIKSIEYISKDQALEIFNETNKDNPILMQALEEVGGNPLLPSLNITTDGNPEQYASVSNILQTSDFSKLIDRVDFSQKKATIEKIYSITSNINTFTLILGAILVAIAVMVVFNTIKLVIGNSKDEISTMKVVGASDKFIRGPFVIQGIIYGIIAFLICFLVSGLCAYLLSLSTQMLLPGFNAFRFFLTNWWIFVLIQLGFGVTVGAVSALIVIKRHLEV